MEEVFRPSAKDNFPLALVHNETLTVLLNIMEGIVILQLTVTETSRIKWPKGKEGFTQKHCSTR